MTRRPRIIPAGSIPIALGIVATMAFSWWAPWTQVHPVDPSLVIATIHAPIWNKPTAAGAHFELDASGLALRLVAVWAAVGVWLGLSSDRWS